MSRRDRWNRLKNRDAGMPSFIALFPNESNSELYFIKVIEKHPDGDKMLTALEEWHDKWLEDLAKKEIVDREREGWNKVREARNKALLLCDWSQLSDAPIDSKTRKLYKDYRQYLRDLPTLFSRYDQVFIRTFEEFVKNPPR